MYTCWFCIKSDAENTENIFIWLKTQIKVLGFNILLDVNIA